MLHDSENESEFTALPELCEASKLSVISHAVAAYAGSMERNHVAHLSCKISNDTAHWITDLFRCILFLNQVKYNCEGLILIFGYSMNIELYSKYEDEKRK